MEGVEALRKESTPTRGHQKLVKNLKDNLGEGMELAVKDSFRGRLSAKMHVVDGWANFLTGFGTSRDKRMANYAGWGLTLTETVAEDLFAADSLARRIVEILPNDATREWIEWEKEVDKDPLDEEMDRLQVKQRLQEAWIFARLYGGGSLFINDGTPVEDLRKPLRADSIGKIQSLTALTRWETWAWATDLQRDISKPDFGLPLRYKLYPRMAFGQNQIEIHASRIIRFDGRKLPRLLHIRNNFWGDSILTPLYQALGDMQVSHHAVANVLQEFRILVHKIGGLTEIINGGGEQQIQKRIEIMNQARSVLGTMLVDKDTDEFEFFSSTLTGVSELVDKLRQLLQALTDIPHTILFNEAPGHSGSMGASGNHEERNWYNTVRAQQVNYLKPRLDQVLKLIFAQHDGPFKGMEPENWEYTFKPLWQMDEKEKADTYYAEAQGDNIYVELGVINQAQLQAKRFPDLAVDPKPDLETLNTQPLEGAKPVKPDNEPEV